MGLFRAARAMGWLEWGLLAGTLAGCDTRLEAVRASPEGAPLVAERGSFEKRVLLTGVLEAVQAAHVTCPRTPTWQVPIRWMAEDGALVEKGETILELDREDLTEIRKKSPGLTRRDVEAIEDAVPGIVWVAPRVKIEPYEVRSGRERTEAVAYGVSRRHFERSSFRLRRGRLFDREDERTHAQIAVLGAGVYRALFGPGAPIGRELKVNDVWLTVVGVLEPEGASDESPGKARPSATSGEIYLPYTTALRKLDRPPLESPLDQIIVHVEPGRSPWETTSVLDPLLSHLHGGERDYTLVVPEALLAQSRETQRLFNIVMVCIAGHTIVVVTHDDVVARRAARSVHLRDGRLDPS